MEINGGLKAYFDRETSLFNLRNPQTKKPMDRIYEWNFNEKSNLRDEPPTKDILAEMMQSHDVAVSSLQTADY